MQHIDHYPEVEVVSVDAGYKTPWICKQIIDTGRIPSLFYKRPRSLLWYEYVYDKYYDYVLYSQYKTLQCATANREGYREYKSKGYICRSCSVRQQCIQNSSASKPSLAVSVRIT